MSANDNASTRQLLLASLAAVPPRSPAMSAETLNEIRSANHRAAERRRDDAIAWADAETLIRDCYDAAALVLKDVESPEADEILMALEELKGRAGRMQMECED